MDVELAPQTILELLKDEILEVIFPGDRAGKREDGDAEHHQGENNDQSEPK
jgi:hypothetical protein